MFLVDGRALGGRGGRTSFGCRSEVVLFTPTAMMMSRRHMDLAVVTAVLHEYFLCRIEHGVRSNFSVTFCLVVCTLDQDSADKLKSDMKIVPRVVCQLSVVGCSFFKCRKLYQPRVEVVCRTSRKKVSHASLH